jgi:copper(I)-binding protein
MSAQAHDYDIGSIHIDHPWARATPKGAKVGGGYMTITNRGTSADRLTSVSAAVANRAVIHEMTMDGGIMKMRPLENGIEIKPGATVALNTDSMHIMFEGLKQPLEEGQRLKATLVFEKAGSIEVEYAVEGMGAKSPAPMSSMPSMPPPTTTHDH